MVYEYFIVPSVALFFLYKYKKFDFNTIVKLQNMSNLTRAKAGERYYLFKTSDAHTYEKMSIFSDQLIFGGDSNAEFDFNINNDSIKIYGELYQRDKSIIDFPHMFAGIICKDKSILKDYNKVYIRAKINANLVKFTLGVSEDMNQIRDYQAHIIDNTEKSHGFNTYELPLSNLKCILNYEDRDFFNFQAEKINLKYWRFEVESKFPQKFEVELKEIYLETEENLEKDYEKYLLPIFLRI
jgi:hypothetical protein